MGQAAETITEISFPTITQQNCILKTKSSSVNNLESVIGFNLENQSTSNHKSMSYLNDSQNLIKHDNSSQDAQDNCYTTFDSSNEVNVNDESHHSESHESPVQVADTSQNEKKHQCTFPGCGAKFLKPSRLLRHTRNHTGERPYPCTYPGCERTYTNSSHLTRHLKVNHTIKTDEKFPCHQCEVVTSSAYSLKRHQQRAHERINKFICTTCHAAFNKRSRLSIHEATHKADELYHCAKCNKSFSFAYRFRCHMKSHEKKSYPCKNEKCCQVFEKWTDLQKHCKDNHPPDYKCSECEESFTSKLKLRTHCKIHTKDPERLYCPHEGCDRYYQHKRNLDSHVRCTHLGLKYYCDFCNRGLVSKQCLTRHIICQHMSNEVVKRKKVVKKSSGRCKRKDANTIKTSIINKMIGINLPPTYNRVVLHRKIEPSKNLVKIEDESNRQLLWDSSFSS